MKAHHLVYTNVEANDSPQKRGGDQTLCWSFDWAKPELDDADRRAIEQRLFYPAKSGEPKFIYFHIPRRWVVVARALPLQERDAFGRAGRIFAHALLLTSEQFEQLGADPFVLIHRFGWYSNLQDVGSAATTGQLEPVELPDPAAGNSPTTRPDMLAPLRDAPFAECVKPWLMLASQAGTLHQQRRAVAVLGSPTDALAWVETLFRVMPVAQRRLAWFDTFYKEDKFNHCYVWLAAFPPNTPTRPYFIRFDLRKRLFQGLTALRDYPATTAYEKRWLEGHIQPHWPRSLETLATQAELAAQLLERLERLSQPFTGPVEHADPADLDLFNGLFATWDQAILDKRSHELLKWSTGSDVLAKLCQPNLAELLARRDLDTLRLLERGVSQSACLGWLVEHLGRLPGGECVLNGPEADALSAFYRSLSPNDKRSDDGLRLEFILALHRRDWPEVVRLLDEAARQSSSPQDRFAWMTEWARQPLAAQLRQALSDCIGSKVVANLLWPMLETWLDEQQAADGMAKYRYLDTNAHPFAWDQLPEATFNQCVATLYRHYAASNSRLTDESERLALERLPLRPAANRTHLGLQLVYWLRTDAWPELTECLRSHAHDSELQKWFIDWASDSSRGDDRIVVRLFEVLTTTFGGNEELASQLLTKARRWLYDDFADRLETLAAEASFPPEIICGWLEATIEEYPDILLDLELADQVCGWLQNDPHLKQQYRTLAVCVYRQSSDFQLLCESLYHDGGLDEYALHRLRYLTDGSMIRLRELDLQAEPPDHASAVVVLDLQQDHPPSVRKQRLLALHALTDTTANLTVPVWWWLVSRLSPPNAKIDRGGHYKLTADHPEIRCNFAVDPNGGAINFSLRFPIPRERFGNFCQVLYAAHQNSSSVYGWNGRASGSTNLTPDTWYDLLQTWLDIASGKEPSRR